MGSNTIIAIVVGAILVIVGFALWPVLNGASNSLYSYFQNSCVADGGAGYRFTKVYVGDDSTSLPSPLASDAYYTDFGVHGGAGSAVSEDRIQSGRASGAVDEDCEVTVTMPEDIITKYEYVAAPSGPPPAPTNTPIGSNSLDLYNEYGDNVGSLTVNLGAPTDVGQTTAKVGYIKIPKGTSIIVEELVGNNISFSLLTDLETAAAVGGPYTAATNGNLSSTGPAITANVTEWSGYMWTKVAPMLDRFSGINNLLLTVIPVVSIAGFLGISGAKLYSYGKGTSSIGSSISTSVFTLIGIVIAMVIAGPVLGQAVDANQVVVSGQYQVNGTFGNIISLLFAMIPVIYIAGLVTLVGLQARTALMGGK